LSITAILSFAPLKKIKYNKENMFNIKLTPATIFMLPLAISLDIAGVLFLAVGWDLGVIGVVGSIFIDTWLFFQGSSPAKESRGITGFFKKLLRGNITKYLVPTIFELLPGIEALPFFTLSVLANLDQ
jgi:hypothetical protein